MFKKPPSNLKTSAPLRSSDRRKLKQRVAQRFALDPEIADLLVPDGLLSMKFSTHTGEPGLFYLAADGGPLWFTIGKDSDEMIPTVYTLWKHPTLLPFVSTPAAVIPVLTGGADLMAPGIVERPHALQANSLVCVTKYERDARGPPLAVGHMLVDAERLTDGAKGKAVTILHTWKDHLWSMGDKGEPPASVPTAAQEEVEFGEGDNEPKEGVMPRMSEDPDDTSEVPGTSTNESASEHPVMQEADSPQETKFSPEEVSAILRTSLLQALRTSLSSLPLSVFPIPATTFYASYILPARPASATPTTPIDIKHSAFKSLAVLLRQSEKQGLLKLKDARPDVVITAVFPDHADVVAHTLHRTVGEIENRKKREQEKSEKKAQEEGEKEKSMSITELWKPHSGSVKFFQEAGMDSSALYTVSEIKTTLDGYIAAHDLVNKAEQQYINVGDDALLRTTLYAPSGKSGAQPPEFAKRGELVSTLCGRMQAFYKIQVGNGEALTKKGQLHPISVVVKIRQGRKACTLITGYEPFFLTSGTIADTLRAQCASATSVSPIAGRAAGEEVMVQGKQTKPVVNFLLGMGVPKEWIETADLTGKKK